MSTGSVRGWEQNQIWNSGILSPSSVFFFFSSTRHSQIVFCRNGHSLEGNLTQWKDLAIFSRINTLLNNHPDLLKMSYAFSWQGSLCTKHCEFSWKLHFTTVIIPLSNWQAEKMCLLLLCTSWWGLSAVTKGPAFLLGYQAVTKSAFICKI